MSVSAPLSCNPESQRPILPLDSRGLKAFLGGSDDKESTCNAGDLGLIAELGRSPGGGHGNRLQYSCLENPTEEEPGGLQSMGSQRVRHN